MSTKCWGIRWSSRWSVGNPVYHTVIKWQHISWSNKEQKRNQHCCRTPMPVLALRQGFGPELGPGPRQTLQPGYRSVPGQTPRLGHRTKTPLEATSMRLTASLASSAGSPTDNHRPECRRYQSEGEWTHRPSYRSGPTVHLPTTSKVLQKATVTPPYKRACPFMMLRPVGYPHTSS